MPYYAIPKEQKINKFVNQKDHEYYQSNFFYVLLYQNNHLVEKRKAIEEP